MAISLDVVERHGLTLVEYEQILRLLGREPNITELGLFSVMWSEHCSYKSSRVHLQKLPTRGPCVVQGPGENAGVVNIGQGKAAVFKIESHNHPSYIEPYQGAATGVGGIIRDIFTMGARPIALMNSLHFGPLGNDANQLIMEGVVAGIAGYGNCVGVPTVGGEIYFQERYSHNPIVNVFCLGIARHEDIRYGRASGTDNPVIYVGSKTGRDGIHGATMASEEFSEDSEAKRPTVQVGDPFMEKLLLEACLEAMQTGAVVGIQDMGAAGLTCSTSEMAHRAGMGIDIDLDRVPQREKGMTPYEMLLSESQERMLLVAEKGREEEVLEVFRKWDLDAVIVGSVKDHRRLMIYRNGEKVVDLPNDSLTQAAPIYQRPTQQPSYRDDLPSWTDLDFPEPTDYPQLLSDLTRSEHLCSRRWVYQQYDHMVQTNTVALPGGDAAVIRLKGNAGALAVSLDGNSRFCHLDPRRGAMLAVAESCRNLVCVGARPLAATNCLNFASPENAETMWQFVECVEGLASACESFQTPITGGNVSFYNETRGKGIFPTPVVGMVGKIEDSQKLRASPFRKAGDFVYLLGTTEAELGGSAYLEVLGLALSGPCPQLDLSREQALQRVLLQGIDEGWMESAHDLSDGGLFLGLVECCTGGGCGVEVELETPLRADHLLLSETASRAIVSVSPEHEASFSKLAAALPALRIGQVVPDRFRLTINGSVLISSPLEDILLGWDSSLEKLFKH